MKKITLLIAFIFSFCALSVSAQTSSNVQSEKKVSTRQSVSTTLEKSKTENKTNTATDEKAVESNSSTKTTSGCAGSSKVVQRKCPNSGTKCNKPCGQNQVKKTELNDTKVVVPKQ